MQRLNKKYHMMAALHDNIAEAENPVTPSATQCSEVLLHHNTFYNRLLLKYIGHWRLTPLINSKIQCYMISFIFL